MQTPPSGRRLIAELLGSAMLAPLVIGSGIAAQALSSNGHRVDSLVAELDGNGT